MVNPLTEKVVKYVKDNPHKFTCNELSTRFGISADAVRGMLKRRGLKGLLKPDISSLKGEPTMEPTQSDLRALLEECEQYGIDIDNVKHFWHKTKKISMFVVAQNRPTYEAVRDKLIREMKAHAPIYKPVAYKKITSPHLLVIDPADLHIGKLSLKCETGFNYDIQAALVMAEQGVTGLLQKAQGFPIDQIILVIGNDVLHVDTPRRTTTKGTEQDTDGQWHEAFTAARKLYVRTIEELRAYAKVHVIYNPSNHDFVSGYMLSDALACWFHKDKDVTFDVDMRHRKYYRYGKNLIATTHGDGAKNLEMPLLMAQEASQMWADTRHRYIYQHHLHHKVKVNWQSVKDYPGITLEILRSPSAPDAWHDRNGYVGTPQAIEGFIHHFDNGQVARLSHIFE